VVLCGAVKALTHDIFSTGVALYVFPIAYQMGHLPLVTDLLLVVWLAFATNKVIDVVGHKSRGGYSIRSFWTHSIFTAPIWGITIVAVSLYLLDIIAGQAMTASQALFAAGIGVILAYSHLFLDSLTEGGVFFWRRRLALAHFRNNNQVLNGIFAMLGAALVVATII
jgi:hypothetical protein